MMTKSPLASPFISTLVLVAMLLVSGGAPMLALAQQQKTWCVAKPPASDAALISNINFCCNQVGLNCGAIQEGGACYFPNTLTNHASVVMNLYYQTYNRNPWNCDFGGSGLTSLTDPSYGNCNYA